MSVIKLQFGTDVRRVPLQENQVLSFADLTKLTKETFAEISTLENFIYKYVDGENDKVSVTNDLELQEAFRVSKESTSILKFEVLWNGCPFEECFKKVKSCIEKNSAFLCPKKEGEPSALEQGSGVCRKIFFAGIIGFLMCRGVCFFYLFPLAFMYFMAQKFLWGNCNRRARERGCGRSRQPRNAEPKPIIVEEMIREVKLEEARNNNNNNVQPFQVKLAQLEEMGFTSRGKNIELLINNSGDVLKTVKELLEKNN